MILTIITIFFVFFLCSCDGATEATCAGCVPPNIVTTAFLPGTSDSVQFSTIKELSFSGKDSITLWAPLREGSLYGIGNYQEISAYCDNSNNVIGNEKHKISGDTLFFWLSYEGISQNFTEAALCVEIDPMYGLLPRVVIDFEENPHINYFVILGINPILYNVRFTGER